MTYATQEGIGPSRGVEQVVQRVEHIIEHTNCVRDAWHQALRRYPHNHDACESHALVSSAVPIAESVTLAGMAARTRAAAQPAPHATRARGSRQHRGHTKPEPVQERSAEEEAVRPRLARVHRLRGRVSTRPHAHTSRGSRRRSTWARGTRGRPRGGRGRATRARRHRGRRVRALPAPRGSTAHALCSASATPADPPARASVSASGPSVERLSRIRVRKRVADAGPALCALVIHLHPFFN
jgi:hypothetical protein